MKIYLRSFENEERQVTLDELRDELTKADDNIYSIELVYIDSNGALHFEAVIFGQYE